MDDLFNDLRDDDFVEETSPMSDLPATSEMDDLPQTRPFSVADDEFDMLREKTVRTESTYSGMDTSDGDFGSGFALSNFTSSQKLILLALLLLDIVAVGFGFLVLLGRI